MAKNFGVAPDIVNDLKLNGSPPGLERLENEDLAVRSVGLSAGLTRELVETSPPRDKTNWISVGMQHVSSTLAPNVPIRTVTVWLPKDRAMTKRMVDVYFTRLDYHRPTFNRRDFENTLERLYENQHVQHDPGFVCSFYLVLALGTMCDLNRALSETTGGTMNMMKLHPQGWPEHVEFFERALAIKPDLRVTLSSLQALILLHWYLYTEVRLISNHSSSGLLISLPNSDKDDLYGVWSVTWSALRSSWACIMIPHSNTKHFRMKSPSYVLGSGPQS